MMRRQRSPAHPPTADNDLKDVYYIFIRFLLKNTFYSSPQSFQMLGIESGISTAQDCNNMNISATRLASRRIMNYTQIVRRNLRDWLNAF
jgi:hypothetical protein